MVILIIMAALSFIGKIETIAMIANLFIFITFFSVNLSVIVLRRSAPEIKRPFKIPFNISDIPIISLLGMLMTAVLFGFNVYSLINN